MFMILRAFRLCTLCAVCALCFLPAAAGAHGAMQKIVDGKYLLNLTSIPIAPYAGQEQQNIVAVSDLQENLIKENAVFGIELKQNDTVVYSAKNLVATGGLLPFLYTYAKPGNYELFFAFQMPGDPTLYQPQDYWIQVVEKPQAVSGSSAIPTVLAGVLGLVSGFLFRGLKRT